MMEGMLRIIVFLAAFPTFVTSNAWCGWGPHKELCHGLEAYCCVLVSGAEGCCYDLPLYQKMWFWGVITGIFLLGVIIMLLQRFRKRRKEERLDLENNNLIDARRTQSYGTNVQSEKGTTTTHRGHPGTPGPATYPAQHAPYTAHHHLHAPSPPPSYSTVRPMVPPPSYGASEATKHSNNSPPPSYSALSFYVASREHPPHPMDE